MTNKIKKYRYKYTKEQKERILYEISLNKSVDEAFAAIEIDVHKLNTVDEKYKAKLISKWKKELYSNKDNISVLNKNNQLIQLEKEINQFSNEDVILAYYGQD